MIKAQQRASRARMAAVDARLRAQLQAALEQVRSGSGKTFAASFSAVSMIHRASKVCSIAKIGADTAENELTFAKKLITFREHFEVDRGLELAVEGRAVLRGLLGDAPSDAPSNGISNGGGGAKPAAAAASPAKQAMFFLTFIRTSGEFLTNFGRLVLGCINAKFCK